jgi:hypothetical protein
MSSRPTHDVAPTLVLRAVRVRPTRHRRHAMIRVIGEDPSAAGRGVVHIIAPSPFDPAAA